MADIKILLYKIYKEKDLEINLENFIIFVDSVLSDKRGWKGYKFINQQLLDKNSEHKKNKIDFKIIISKPKTIVNKCQLYGLSCTNMKKKIIYINYNRYKTGAKKSQLSLKDYRIYLINHEVGHILGKGHVKCPCNNSCNQLVPVMNQATRGIGLCKPNPWPIDIDNKL